MKKRLLFVMFLLLLTVLLSFKVNAAVKFPDRITPSYSELITKYNKSLYKKGYESADNSVKAGGKAFCTSFWNLAPSGVTCTKTNWVNGNNENNVKASAAVGYIINKIRNSDGSISWDNYYYGELAINKFLYDNGLGGPVNNINNFPKEILNQIKGLVANATAVYKTYYNNDKAEITGIFLNGKEVNNDGTITVNQASKYTLKVVMKCTDKNGGSHMKCDLPKSDGTINGATLPNPTVTNSGKYTIFYYDLSNKINNSTQITVNVSNHRKYYYAQRYDCKNNNQTLTPNYLNTNYSDRKSDNKNITVTLNVPTPSQPNTCEGQITNNPVSNASLYQNYKNQSKNYEHLLDVNNPECKGAEQTENVSCENSVISNEWVEQIDYSEISPGSHYSALCKATYSFENLVYDNNVSKNGDLLFKTVDDDNPVYGKAIINYDCNIPYLMGNNTSTIVKNKQIDLREILPKVKLTADFGEEKKVVEEQIGSATVSSELSTCKVESGKVICSNYNNSNNGYGWSFRLEVYYDFTDQDEDYKYTVSKENGELVNWHEGDQLYGYGVLVPNNIVNKDGNYYIDYDFSSTKFKSDEQSKYETKATCEYKIANDDIRKQVKYRTIDINNPFNDINGSARFTGSNWCGDDIGEGVIEDIEATDKQSLCLYPGDVNRNYRWDEEDVSLIKKYTVGLPIDTSYSDYNGDGATDVLDAVAIEKIIVGKINYDLGDVNLDGVVDQKDLDLLQQYINYLENGGNKVVLNGYQQKIADLDTSICGIDKNDYSVLKNTINNTPSEGYSVENNELDLNENNIKENTDSKRCTVKNNDLVKKYITDRPSSNSKNPIYSFTLDAKTIKEIRESNKEYNYNQNNGLKEASDFLQKIYDRVTDSVNSLCFEQTKQNGYCNVEQALKNKEDA